MITGEQPGLGNNEAMIQVLTSAGLVWTYFDAVRQAE